MGLRSWLTPIKDSGKDWDRFQELLKHNRLALDIDYVIEITADCPLSKGLWVAWSGDTNASLDAMGSYRRRTRFLDDFLDEFPGFREPPNFGVMLTAETMAQREAREVVRWEAEQRRLRREGQLSPYKIAKLEAIPGWSWETPPTPESE
jgi:hypothetical protein